MEMTLGEIAAIVGGSVEGDANFPITGLNGLKEAAPGDLSFFADPRYLPHLETTRAAALIVGAGFKDPRWPVVRVANPFLAFAQILKYLETVRLVHPKGIHPSAAVAATAVLGKDVALDGHVCIAEGARIGDRTVLYAGVYIGRDTIIGPDCVLYPHVSVRERVQIGARCIIHANSSIGSDGFGFTRVGGKPFKVPQVGGVIIGDDVEIGSNSAVDRSTTGNTTIGSRTKIDNLVQIAHNVAIGTDCTISSGMGMGGSTTVGNNVTTGGQAGVAGHLTIGDNVYVAARAGITKSVPPNTVVSGFPHEEHDVMQRMLASLRRLPDALRRLRKLETDVEGLTRPSDDQTADD